MQKKAQILLYNQLRKDYCMEDIDTFCYIHHTGKILFQGKNLNLNTASKIIDYAGGKYMIDMVKKEGHTAEFLIEKTFTAGIQKFSQKYDINHFVLKIPTENYVYENFQKIAKELKKDNIILDFIEDSESFFLSHSDFLQQYEKPPIMEYFYRYMRKKENILVDASGDPEGGQWNYDKENRKFDKNHEKTWNFSLEKSDWLKEAEAYYDYELQFPQPTNRPEALRLLEYFLNNHIDNFGRLEDAMYQDDPYVHHSLLSSSINYGFLSPREVVQAVCDTDTAMNNKEGFTRQILGWREYMYHFFQYYKKDIYAENYFSHTKTLPDFFWDNAKTCKMNCLSTSLEQVQSKNMSHHIQRLMIIGNFALLGNYDPHELNRWFFEYYTDAFEWVVTPNVLAMSQFADGGKLATKPYVASANYINKMSNYCKNCSYDYKEKYTDTACPYNYLYWSFVDDNTQTFEKGRQQFVVNNLKKIDRKKIQELKKAFTK